MNEAKWRQFKAAMKEYALSTTFEAQVRPLEQICKATPGVLPNRPFDSSPEAESRAWYAEAILFAIRSARHFIERGDAAWASAEALSIGALATQAARLDWPELRGWRELQDNQSKEGALIGRVIQVISFAGQGWRIHPANTFAIDMEVEFKGSDGYPSGKKIALQLKSGDSHLRFRESDHCEVFDIKNEHHAEYWTKHPDPVYLIIADSRGLVRWMEVRDYLRNETATIGQIPKQIVFKGEKFTQESVLQWRRKMLDE